MTPKWPKEFDKLFVGDNRPDGMGYKLHLEVKSFIETEIIEKIIGDLETNPYVSSVDPEDYSVSYWIEKKQAQLRNNWLGKE